MSGISLAMWSGPRNISTAMMRAWENRADTTVVDEAFYAHYLKHTGLDHPLAAEIIEAGETDWQRVVAEIRQVPDQGVFYQKHITSHMLDHIGLDWMADIQHAFLIREPHDAVASFALKYSNIQAADVGYERQRALFDTVLALQTNTPGMKPPVVLDSVRFLTNPEAHLRAVCAHFDIEFDPAMLSWPTGPRNSDGLWHRHWYDAVKRSTGFGSARSERASLDAHQSAIVEQCRPDYEHMLKHALDL